MKAFLTSWCVCFNLIIFINLALSVSYLFMFRLLDLEFSTEPLVTFEYMLQETLCSLSWANGTLTILKAYLEFSWQVC